LATCEIPIEDRDEWLAAGLEALSSVSAFVPPNPGAAESPEPFDALP
jgi:hypothetical protein